MAFVSTGVLRGTRTPDRALRRRMLYPAELSGQCLTIIPNSLIPFKTLRKELSRIIIALNFDLAFIDGNQGITRRSHITIMIKRTRINQ